MYNNHYTATTVGIRIRNGRIYNINTYIIYKTIAEHKQTWNGLKTGTHKFQCMKILINIQ